MADLQHAMRVACDAPLPSPTQQDQPPKQDQPEAPPQQPPTQQQPNHGEHPQTSPRQQQEIASHTQMLQSSSTETPSTDDIFDLIQTHGLAGLTTQEQEEVNNCQRGKNNKKYVKN